VNGAASDFEAVVERFRHAKASPSGECPEKLEAVREAAGYLPAPEALEFVTSTLGNPSEYDLARVELCKALRVYEPASAAISHACATALLAALRDPEDELVRQWAALALANFVAVDGVAPELVARVVDPTEDIDVRHNSLGALRAGTFPGESRAALETGTEDEEINDAIHRDLAGA
jgi:hypothetical protein